MIEGGRYACVIEQFDDVFQLDVRWRHIGFDDHAGQEATADGHADPRPDDRRRHRLRNAIREEIEERNGDGDGDEHLSQNCNLRMHLSNAFE